MPVIRQRLAALAFGLLGQSIKPGRSIGSSLLELSSVKELRPVRACETATCILMSLSAYS